MQISLHDFSDLCSVSVLLSYEVSFFIYFLLVNEWEAERSTLIMIAGEVKLEVEFLNMRF